MLVVLCFGMFLVLLDVTVVNVALPGIGRSLGADRAGLQGVVDAYAVALASLLLGVGAVGDRFGHRRAVASGVAVFGLASLGCGLAPGIGWLIAARAAQGVGAALLLPGSLALVTALFPERREQARALGVWAAVSSLALPVGPVLGGWLVDAAGWRWVFLLNVPVTAVVAVAVIVVVREPAAPRARRGLDVRGLALAPVALGSSVWAVIAYGHGAGRTAAAAGAVAVLAGALLVAAERRTREPMIPARLFRVRGVAAANGVALLMNLVTNGTLLVVTLYLQQVRGWSALSAGLMLVPMAAPLVLMAPVSGALTARYGPRAVVVSGAAVALAGSLSLLLVRTDGGPVLLLPALVGLGVGNGLLVSAVVAGAMRALPSDRAGLAGGLNNTARQVGTALGVAIFGAVVGPATPTQFVPRLHILAYTATAMWATAIALATRLPTSREADASR
jgi:DHA2 family methylenomycin A resistance protein-like MFS transporter